MLLQPVLINFDFLVFNSRSLYHPSSLTGVAVALLTLQMVRLSVEPLAPELELRKLQSSDKLLSADFLFLFERNFLFLSLEMQAFFLNSNCSRNQPLLLFTALMSSIGSNSQVKFQFLYLESKKTSFFVFLQVSSGLIDILGPIYLKFVSVVLIQGIFLDAKSCGQSLL